MREYLHAALQSAQSFQPNTLNQLNLLQKCKRLPRLGGFECQVITLDSHSVVFVFSDTPPQ